MRLKTETEISELTKLQARLLAAAGEMLAPEGILVYCVCSLQPEEGAHLVDSSITEGLPLRRAPLGESELRGFEQFLTSVGDLRTLPSQMADCGGLDGFYAARLRRSANARDV
jgi:16S rRNA (cytosine967-C5)-methyltransferase